MPELNFDDWIESYGVCNECAVDIVMVDRDTWLDDKCHRHQFQRLIEMPYTIWEDLKR